MDQGGSRRDVLKGLGLAGVAGVAPATAEAMSGAARQPGPPGRPERRPNILVILLDDVGFSDLGCYGGEIRTPNIDGLAAEGLKYTNFRTAAVCSATRAALLTGLNSHSAGIGQLTQEDRGYPGYRGDLTRQAATFAETLRQNGYMTHHVGKWHVNHVRSSGQAGPMYNWPLQRGFDRAYWFQGHSSDYFRPSQMFDGNSATEIEPRDDYYTTDDFTDKAIDYLRDTRNLNPDNPWLLYLAYNGAHSPLQSRAADRDRYKGRYDAGWDSVRAERLARQKALGVAAADVRLPPSNPGVSAWAALSADEQRAYARYMEVYAGVIDRLDWNIGRLVSELKTSGVLDDTFVILMSDNGGSGEGTATGTPNILAGITHLIPVAEVLRQYDEMGGPDTLPHYPTGWAMASNTPYRMYKQTSFLGGISDPMIVRWPAGAVPKGELRDQFVHVIDVYPTLLEVAGVAPLKDYGGRRLKPLEGASFARTFARADAPPPRTDQYFEINGYRAMYSKGWHIVAFPGAPWQLYDQRTDPTEIDDQANSRPDKVEELEAKWLDAARRYNVLPIDNRNFLVKARMARWEVPQRSHWELVPPTGIIPPDVAPMVAGRDHVIRIDLERRSPSDDGVLLAYGSLFYGWVLYVQNSCLVYETSNRPFGFRIVSRAELPVGRFDVSFVQKMVRRPYDGSGDLYVGPDLVASTRDVLFGVAYQGLQVGRNDSIPVTRRYAAPFAFAGRIHKVTIDYDTRQYTAAELAEMKARMRLHL